MQKYTVISIFILWGSILRINAQGAEYALDAGGGINGLVSKASSKQASMHGLLGLHIKAYRQPKLYSSIGIQLLIHNQSPFTSSFFEPRLNRLLTLQTSFTQYELGFPAFIGTHY